MASFGIKWYENTLLPHMVLFAVAAEAGLHKHVDDMAVKVEEYAKENAPWEDRTGDARAGLTAEARHQHTHYYIDLFHTVDYGVWLEVRWNGRYAIIEPTLQHFGPQVMSELSWMEMLAYGAI